MKQKQNLIFELVWASWTVENSCTFYNYILRVALILEWWLGSAKQDFWGPGAKS